jgi:hypothetical protein
MLLADFFSSSTEGESYANRKTTSEARGNKQANPCWKGYNQVGTKTKGNKTVPNCVPNKKVTEGSFMDEESNQGNEDFVNYIDQDEVDNKGYMPDLLRAKELIIQALRDPEARGDYFNFLKAIRTSHSEQYSTMIHKKASELAKENKVH